MIDKYDPTTLTRHELAQMYQRLEDDRIEINQLLSDLKSANRAIDVMQKHSAEYQQKIAVLTSELQRYRIHHRIDNDLIYRLKTEGHITGLSLADIQDMRKQMLADEQGGEHETP